MGYGSGHGGQSRGPPVRRAATVPRAARGRMSGLLPRPTIRQRGEEHDPRGSKAPRDNWPSLLTRRWRSGGHDVLDGIIRELIDYQKAKGRSLEREGVGTGHAVR